MSIKNIFESQMAQQRIEIARQALKQAFRGNIPARATLKELLDEIREDDALWKAFIDLRFDEFKDMISPPPTAYGPPGPTRKRGVTAGRIVKYVKDNPGARRSDIMKALGLKGGTSSSQLRVLRAMGKLRGEGPERNIQYYVG